MTATTPGAAPENTGAGGAGRARSDGLHVERRGQALLLTIDRPERRNAVDRQLLSRLLAALHEDPEARVLVLTGAGGHFCAGADLTGLEDSSFAVALREVLVAFTTTPRPVIAAVAGAAMGAGTQLAMACDMVVATPGARFGIPAVRLGLMVDHWTVQRLALSIGHSPARAMLLAAETLDGVTAHRLGLVHRLGALDEALAWAEEVAALAPLSIAGHKLMLQTLEPELPTDPAVRTAFERAWQSEDLQEGFASFRERRSPVFRGR